MEAVNGHVRLLRGGSIFSLSQVYKEYFLLPPFSPKIQILMPDRPVL